MRTEAELAAAPSIEPAPNTIVSGQQHVAAPEAIAERAHREHERCEYHGVGVGDPGQLRGRSPDGDRHVGQ